MVEIWSEWEYLTRPSDADGIGSAILLKQVKAFLLIELMLYYCPKFSRYIHAIGFIV